MVSEAAKDVGYIVGGGLAGYAIDNVMEFVDAAVPTLTGITMPSSIVTLVGGIAVPIYAAYRKKASAKTRMFLAGVAAYYIPATIELARSLAGLSATPVRFRKVIPSGLGGPMPAYPAPASMAQGYSAKIF